MKVKYIFNPFERIAGWQALLAGLIVMILTAGLAVFSGLRFDGVLDAHFDLGIPWWLPFAHQGINWIVLVVVFYIAALLFGRAHIRFIDIAGTMALARAPMLLASLAGIPGIINAFFKQIPTVNSNDILTMPAFWLTVILALLIVWGTVWSAILIYNALSVSANMKGARAGVVYAFGLVVAEIASKIVIAHI